MEYLIGLLLSLAVAGLAALIGLDRERSFHSTAVIVIASYYILFAMMGASKRTLGIEIALAFGILLVRHSRPQTKSLDRSRRHGGHGVFDFVHHLFIATPGVLSWWPGFCLAFDEVFGTFLALRLMTPNGWSTYLNRVLKPFGVWCSKGLGL
jgi:hypothetical protein